MAQHENRIYIGGFFTTVDGVPRRSLAAFHALTGELDPDWDPNVDGFVLALAVKGDRLYVGGQFLDVNDGVTRRNLAAFELAGGGRTGRLDAVWDPQVNYYVETLAVTDDLVYAGGVFAGVTSGIDEGAARRFLAAFELANDVNIGRVDPAWHPIQGGRSRDKVSSIPIHNSVLYAGGTFGHVNGDVPRSSLAAFELADGSNTGLADPTWDPRMNGGIWASILTASI